MLSAGRAIEASSASLRKRSEGRSRSSMNEKDLIPLDLGDFTADETLYDMRRFAGEKEPGERVAV